MYTDEEIRRMFPLEQMIPFKKLDKLGVGKKLPRKARYIFDNMSILESERNSLYNEYIRKALGQNVSNCCSQRIYNTRIDNIPYYLSLSDGVNLTNSRINLHTEEGSYYGTESELGDTQRRETPSTAPRQNIDNFSPYFPASSPPIDGDGVSYSPPNNSNTGSPTLASPTPSEQEETRQLTHETHRRRRQFRQNPFDNPDVFEPRDNTNVAIPTPTREMGRITHNTARETVRITPPAPLADPQIRDRNSFADRLNDFVSSHTRSRTAREENPIFHRMP